MAPGRARPAGAESQKASLRSSSRNNWRAGSWPLIVYGRSAVIQQDQREAPDQAALQRMRRAFNDPDATEEFSGAASSTMGDEERGSISWEDPDPEC